MHKIKLVPNNLTRVKMIYQISNIWLLRISQYVEEVHILLFPLFQYNQFGRGVHP